VARLDTKNGKAEFVSTLGVKRNVNYVLILKSDGSEITRLVKPKTLESITAILDPVAQQPKTVTVRFPDVRDLARATQERIYALSVNFLATSNFNSAAHAKPFQGGIPRVQAKYRKTVSGRYLTITFQQSRKFKTVGGEITALEIVVGLNRVDYADSLFTIDAEGRVVEHAEFSGTKGIELLKAIKQAIDEG
jgi:hypothetical protein